MSFMNGFFIARSGLSPCNGLIRLINLFLVSLIFQMTSDAVSLFFSFYYQKKKEKNSSWIRELTWASRGTRSEKKITKKSHTRPCWRSVARAGCCGLFLFISNTHITHYYYCQWSCLLEMSSFAERNRKSTIIAFTGGGEGGSLYFTGGATVAFFVAVRV